MSWGTFHVEARAEAMALGPLSYSTSDTAKMGAWTPSWSSFRGQAPALEVRRRPICQSGFQHAIIVLSRIRPAGSRSQIASAPPQTECPASRAVSTFRTGVRQTVCREHRAVAHNRTSRCYSRMPLPDHRRDGSWSASAKNCRELSRERPIQI